MKEAYLTQMKDRENVLEIEGLQTSFFTDRGVVRAVDGVSFCVPAGKTVAVVGESGCGKSVTSLSVMQLLQKPQGKITGGAIRFCPGDKTYDMVKTPEAELRRLRGGQLAMIFQEPMTALNPVLTIGYQLREAVRLHHSNGRSRAFCADRAKVLLEQVGIPDSAAATKKYPHQLSGGMRQRVCIAMALAADPKLIIADEATTALDVTIQAQILDLLQRVQRKSGCAVLFITHDLGVVAQMADVVVVMYGGKVVERGTAAEIFRQPAHPYTRALLRAKPVVGKPVKRLYTISGTVPDPGKLPTHCYFRERCENACAGCETYPGEVALSPTHTVSCWQHFREEENGA